MARGFSPCCSQTRSTDQRSTRAISISAAYGVPPRMMGVGSPTRRLNSRATRPGSVVARRVAASPTRISPSSRRNTTDGTEAERLPRVSASTTPPRSAAAAV
jgi:hypothetical protein